MNRQVHARMVAHSHAGPNNIVRGLQCGPNVSLATPVTGGVAGQSGIAGMSQAHPLLACCNVTPS